MESDQQEEKVMVQEWFVMLQEWFATGAKFGFIGFFTVLTFLMLWVFVLGCIGMIAGRFKGGDDDEP